MCDYTSAIATKLKRPTLDAEAERQERQHQLAAEAFAEAQAMTPEQRLQALRELRKLGRRKVAPSMLLRGHEMIQR